MTLNEECFWYERVFTELFFKRLIMNWIQFFFDKVISLFAICVKRSRATDAKQQDVWASLERGFKEEKNFLMLCKHNINYDFMKTSCVGDIGTVRLHVCCITYKPRNTLSADVNEWEFSRFAISVRVLEPRRLKPLHPLRRTAVFPKAPNKDSLPVLIYHLEATEQLMTEIVILRKITLKLWNWKNFQRVSSLNYLSFCGKNS